ncbi:MAG: CPBP family intramembrane metalloprotease [Gemmatimonadota bacterium]|nr:CPBP family intramembrane metalloprotease [Gemmatimonadota bacterium]
MSSASVRSSLRGFGPVGIITIIVILAVGNLAGAALVLIWAWVSGTRWSDLGFVRPPHGAIDLVIALVAGVFFKVLMKALVMPLLGFGPTNSTYHYLSGNTAALLVTLLWVIVGGGFGEELIWRGFLFERLGALLGPRAHAKVVIVVVTSILFALAHLWDQGIAGAVQASITGLVFGGTYVRIRTIWPVMVAHAAFDVAAVLMIYWNLEQPIGHLLLLRP